MDENPDPIPPSSFADWKERRQFTDEQIAGELRDRGIEVKRAMISAILRGERNAGNQLALALRDLTGLPIELFLLAASKPASTSQPDIAPPSDTTIDEIVGEALAEALPVVPLAAGRRS